MGKQQFNSVAELVEAVADESLAKDIEQQAAARQIVSALVAMRITSDMSQGDVARELGCSQSRISKLENGIDADLSYGDIVKYATCTGRRPLVAFMPLKSTLMDCVKFHAFRISDCLHRMSEISEGDPSMERAAVRAHIEYIANMVRLSVESAVRIPCLEAELQRMMHEMNDGDLVCEYDRAASPKLSIVSEDEPVSA